MSRSDFKAASVEISFEIYVVTEYEWERLVGEIAKRMARVRNEQVEECARSFTG